MHRHLGTVLHTSAVVCSVLLLCAGCGDRTPTATQTPTQTATETPTRTPAPSASQTTPPTEGLQKVRVVGVVERTGDCVVVRDDNDITWTIAGESSDLDSGVRVQVTGTPDLAATGCGGPVVKAARVSVLDGG